jgi:hypothetical protein
MKSDYAQSDIGAKTLKQFTKDYGIGKTSQSTIQQRNTNDSKFKRKHSSA